MRIHKREVRGLYQRQIPMRVAGPVVALACLFGTAAFGAAIAGPLDEWTVVQRVEPQPVDWWGGIGITGLAYGNGQFLAVGGGRMVLSSLDGSSWT